MMIGRFVHSDPQAESAVNCTQECKYMGNYSNYALYFPFAPAECYSSKYLIAICKEHHSVCSL